MSFSALMQNGNLKILISSGHFLRGADKFIKLSLIKEQEYIQIFAAEHHLYPHKP